MVDIFALAVSHGLLALAVWRLMARDDLFDESSVPGKGAAGSARRAAKSKGMKPPRNQAGPDA